MDGAHDMGGMHGFGPIDPEPEQEEPLFHADWERTAFAVTLAAGMLGQWSIDRSRHARENQDPARYLSSSYYEIWMSGLETLLVETGLVTPWEITSGRMTALPSQELNAADAARADALLASGGPTLIDDGPAPAFAVGERVRVLNVHPAGHIRAPRYVRGRVGTIHALHGNHVFPDTSAEGAREGQPLYTVRFEAAELWGPDTTAGAVFADLWQPYLERP